MEIESAALSPLEQDAPNKTAEPRPARLGSAARAPAIVYAAASAMGCVALLVVSLAYLSGRTVNLVSFSLTLLATVAPGLLVWRLHSLWLLLDEPERFPGSHQRDPLKRIALLPLWRDRVMGPLVAVALAANVSLFGYVSHNFTRLPPFLPLHYSAAGEVDRLGTPPEVYMMPAIGLVVVAVNVILAALLCRRERYAASLLVGAGIFVQLVLVIATVNIVSRA